MHVYQVPWSKGSVLPAGPSRSGRERPSTPTSRNSALGQDEPARRLGGTPALQVFTRGCRPGDMTLDRVARASRIRTPRTSHGPADPAPPRARPQGPRMPCSTRAYLLYPYRRSSQEEPHQVPVSAVLMPPALPWPVDEHEPSGPARTECLVECRDGRPGVDNRPAASSTCSTGPAQRIDPATGEASDVGHGAGRR